jgi:hypothetical protein
MIASNLNRHFVKFIAQFGVTIEPGGKHASLMKDGKKVGSMSVTGSDGQHEMFAIQQLVRQGVIPRDKAKYKFG